MREDLVASAVTFLQDPNVASSPLEKKIAFLQSKNLTQEEIDGALLRAGSTPGVPPSFGQAYNTLQQPPQFSNQYGSFFQQQQPPPLPRRDWRDWFIMATVTGGVSYGLYFLAKRYVYPLISPPTPEQLTADKAAIDTAFSQAFALIDQLKTDTEDLKKAELERNKRVDEVLGEVEKITEELGDKQRRAEEERKKIGEEVRGLRDLVPRALDAFKEGQENSLKDLQNELKSLKQLLQTRVGGGGGVPPAPSTLKGKQPYVSSVPATGSPATENVPAPNGVGAGSSSGVASPVSAGFSRGAPSPLPFGGPNKPAIPAWQMAAAAKNNVSMPTPPEASKDT